MALRTVLLADLPFILEDLIVSLVVNRHDLTVVRGSAVDGDLATAAAAAMAQVVVVTRNHPADLGDVDVKLARAANLAIVALAPDGASACLHTLRDDSVQFEDVSAEEILRALAGAPFRENVE